MNFADKISRPGPKRLLALDGGGIRGMISAYMAIRWIAGSAICAAARRLRSNLPILRYNAQLSQAGLAQIKLADIDPSHVQQLDSVAYMPELRRVGEALGQQVTETHFPKAFDC